MANGQLEVKGLADAELQAQRPGFSHWIIHKPVLDLLAVNKPPTHSDLEGLSQICLIIIQM